MFSLRRIHPIKKSKYRIKTSKVKTQIALMSSVYFFKSFNSSADIRLALKIWAQSDVPRLHFSLPIAKAISSLYRMGIGTTTMQIKSLDNLLLKGKHIVKL